ncbi:GGDEF domain-containing protein [Modestobacter sp. VKM Ac-2984]|uniref:GGDEF domain-containing protein n=1 Tax=Modestobacter sp. VKM Ac-2984 TaxID=3004138 RepID=UPI0022AB401F|nr:GGDEF domain-containing protein [Modestobacter sp. VKM Ac-2984]MCZ2814927.1 GGDEF domain-containing protein [Modestobacter sp. VKM Ac-2984]
MRELGERAVARVGRHIEWRAVTLLAICLTGSIPLFVVSGFQRSVGAHADARLAALGASIWGCMAGYVAVRRRLGPRDGAVIIGAASTVMIVEGLCQQEITIRWLCAAALVVVPVAAAMLLRSRGVAATTAVALAGVVAISLTLPTPPLLRVYAALTMVVAVLAPITVVTLLVRRMQAARDLARTLAVTDPLTGLSNRRGIEARAGSIVASAAAAGEQVTVMVLDLDHFKTVNDTHGHAVGDRVLTGVADAMTRIARADDLLVRLGGEELGWVAHFPGPEEVTRAAERLHAAVRDRSVPDLPPVTVSIGVVTAEPAPDQDPVAAVLSLLSTADRALYEAKRAGRDRIAYAPGHPRALSPAS